MTVGTFNLTSFPTQDPATYKSSIDADFAVSKRLIDTFAPHAQAVPNMTVALDAGWLFFGGILTEVAAQNTATISASSLAGITRIDRAVVDALSGAVSVVQGTSVVPAIPTGKLPCAQIAVTTSSTSITNAMLTDERVTPPSASGINYQEFTSTGAFTWNAPAGYSTNASVLAEIWGSGAGGSTLAHGGGGGGAACQVAQLKLSALSTAVTGSIAAGGLAGLTGNNTTFGSFTVYGGAQASSVTANLGGSGAGQFGAGGVAGGGPVGGAAGNPGGSANFGGGGPGNADGSTGGGSVYGGAGGGSGVVTATNAAGPGGPSIYGGGGGGGGSTVAAGLGGVSNFGGNGGKGSTVAGGTGVTGAQPGGGGGNNAPGGNGLVRVWVFP